MDPFRKPLPENRCSLLPSSYTVNSERWVPSHRKCFVDEQCSKCQWNKLVTASRSSVDSHISTVVQQLQTSYTTVSVTAGRISSWVVFAGSQLHLKCSKRYSAVNVRLLAQTEILLEFIWKTLVQFSETRYSAVNLRHWHKLKDCRG